MFDLNEIPTFIKAKKHGKRYSVDLISPATKIDIRYKHRVVKTSVNKLMAYYKLPRRTINKILQESE